MQTTLEVRIAVNIPADAHNHVATALPTPPGLVLKQNPHLPFPDSGHSRHDCLCIMSPPTAQQPTDVELKPVAPNQSRNMSGSAPRSVSNQTVKAKDIQRATTQPPPKQPKQVQSAQAVPVQSQMKKLTRKSSKPIINWFQRKLAGTVRSRRASDADALRAQRAASARPPLKEQHRRSSVPAVPPLPLHVNKNIKNFASQGKKATPVPIGKRNTISLDGSDDFSSLNDGRTIDSSEEYRSSYARESMWSPNSLSVREADEDASVRPLPPSVPPSPSPSHSSSSYLSDPRTFASMAASTKPTTLLSVDLAGGGMAHIAQAPPTPTLSSHRLSSQTRTHSTSPSAVGSITFSPLPAASSRPSSAAHGPSSRNPANHGSLNAPQHTTHHPRYNPRPSSPPPDDASVLTLASSAFGIPGARVGANALLGRRSLADDSISHISGGVGIGDSASHFLSGDMDGDDDRLLSEGDRDGDVDASVRALRPRSSRRGSWESEASGWSAHLGAGTPSVLRERSLWTSGSILTGARSVNIGTEEDYPVDKSEATHEDDRSTAFTGSEVIRDTSQSAGGVANEVEHALSTGDHSNGPQSPTSSLTSSSAMSTEWPGTATPSREKGQETPKVSTLILEDAPPPVPQKPDSSSVAA